MQEHKDGLLTGFSKKYRVIRLVYYEQYADVRDAIVREKQLKKWNRAWKIDLIEQANPKWRDLWFDFKPMIQAMDSRIRGNDKLMA